MWVLQNPSDPPFPPSGWGVPPPGIFYIPLNPPPVRALSPEGSQCPLYATRAASSSHAAGSASDSIGWTQAPVNPPPHSPLITARGPHCAQVQISVP